MTGDKTLSEKINSKWEGFEGLLYVKDVKNFIKEIKEDIDNYPLLPLQKLAVHKIIDKLAGKNLTGKPVNLGK